MNKDRQQGDVILKAIESLPIDAINVKRKDGRIIIMHGESGHTHVITDVDAMFYEKDGRHYLVSTKPVILSHEEHNSQVIEPGVWEIGQVREKDWLTGMVSPVID